MRWRGFLIPVVTLVAILLFFHRMGLLSGYYFLHPEVLYEMFISAPNVYLIVFAPVMMWVYSAPGETTALRAGCVLLNER